MSRSIGVVALVVVLILPAFSQNAQKKRKAKPNINESKEYPGVFYSPSADSTPPVFRSVLQMEIVVKKGDADAEVLYANGTVVSRDGLLVSVIGEPGSNEDETGGIESAAVLLLDGRSSAATLVAYDDAYGVAIFRVKGVELRPLELAKEPLVANRRLNWHAVFKNGRKTFLYTRPLQIHKAAHKLGETEDLCEIIDPGTSSLSAERSGSALVSLDGRLVGIMGRQKSWHVTPKNDPARKKLAWAVPASVIARLLESRNDG